MKKKYNLLKDRKNNSIIRQKEDVNYGCMTIEDVHYVLGELIKKGKGNYTVLFEACSSAIGQISIYDEDKEISLD